MNQAQASHFQTLKCFLKGQEYQVAANILDALSAWRPLCQWSVNDILVIMSFSTDSILFSGMFSKTCIFSFFDSLLCFSLRCFLKTAFIILQLLLEFEQGIFL